MKAPAFTYHDPRTADELVGLLGRVENHRLLAGGQSLMPMLNMRYVLPDHLIDLNRIPELAYVRRAGSTIEIGAMTRQRALQRDPLIEAHAPIVAEALTWVGHVQTRSRGTIGGSLSHLDPSAELPAVCVLYDASMQALGPRGRRTIAAADWSAGYMTPAIEPDEALVGIALPVWVEPHGHAYVEFARRHGDFAIVGAGALLALDTGGVIRRAALVLAGVDTRPIRLAEAERALVGAPAGEAAFAAAAEIARRVECLADAHVSGEYRQRLAGVMTARALAQAAARARVALGN